jgi:predicted RNA-binding Zn ribbon-like protein
MSGPAVSAEPFTFNSGRLCLDFANTIRGRPLSDRVELLSTYADLLSWARHATILTPGETAALAEEAARRPDAAERALGRARSLREAIYALFSARAAGLPAPEADIRTLNIWIGRSFSRSGLSASGGRFEWGWPGVAPDLERPSWWATRSAADLLTSSMITFVRECAGYDCGWLFIDTTKNRSRRWCDMSTCGNRAKGRRHYERRRRAGDGPGART